MSHLITLPEPDPHLADEFAKVLIAKHVDPSDQDRCFDVLCDYHEVIGDAQRWRDVAANIDQAMDAAGRHYIALEMRRAG